MESGQRIRFARYDLVHVRKIDHQGAKANRGDVARIIAYRTSARVSPVSAKVGQGWPGLVSGTERGARHQRANRRGNHG